MKMQRKILEKIFRAVKQPVLVIALFSAVFNLHAVAAQPARADAAEAAMKMVNFTVDAKAELDMQALWACTFFSKVFFIPFPGRR